MVASFVTLACLTGTPQMKRYAGVFSSLIGSTFGTADTGGATDVQGTMPTGRVIRFGGLNTYLAATGNQIYRTTDAGTTWTSVLTLSDIFSESVRKSGFVIFYLNGTPVVCLMYQTSAGGDWKGIYSPDGLSWTNSSTFNGSLSVTTNLEIGFNQMIISNDTIYVIVSAASGVAARILGWIPSANVGFDQAVGVASGDTPAICEFNEGVYVLAEGAATAADILAITGSTQSVALTLSVNLASSIIGSSVLFVDGNNMYAIYRGATTGGLVCFQIDSSLSPTEITATVLPAFLRNDSLDAGLRVNVLIDAASSPGSDPTKYIYFCQTTTTLSRGIWAIYQWNGPSTEITYVGQNGSTLDASPFFRMDVGSYFIEDAEFPSISGIYVEITNRTFIATGVRLSFKIYGSSSVSFRIFIGDSQTEYPTTPGTLIDPSHGSISGSTVNIGLTADNGATTYQVTWDAPTDGFTQNNFYRLIGNVFF